MEARVSRSHFASYLILWLIAFGIGALLKGFTTIPTLPEFATGFLFVFGYWVAVADPSRRSLRTMIGYPIVTGFAFVGVATVWQRVFG